VCPVAADSAAGRHGHPVLSLVSFAVSASLDTHLALILLNATFVLPFVVVIVRQTFLDLPVELEESAMVDGCGHLAAFWRIALPLAAPSIAATGLIIFAFSWNEFAFALAISAQNAVTVPVRMSWAIDTRGVHFWTLGPAPSSPCCRRSAWRSWPSATSSAASRWDRSRVEIVIRWSRHRRATGVAPGAVHRCREARADGDRLHQRAALRQCERRHWRVHRDRCRAGHHWRVVVVDRDGKRAVAHIR
ncbi:MAG: carbohydrate ABC transporter permease, partial [Sphingomonadales bacterium]|nr:carbohydrate ABC transporter permease [Sphingomonadales bacterium]